MIKNIFLTCQIKIEIKTATTRVIKNELKYSAISGGNTCIAEPNLDVYLLKVSKSDVCSDVLYQFMKCHCFTIR